VFDRRKPFVLVAVLGAHVLFVVFVVWQTRVRLASRTGDQFESIVTLITPERPVIQPVQPRLTPAPSSAASVAPPSVEYSAPDDSSTAPIALPQEAPVRAGIDWLGEARRSASKLSGPEAEKLREAERRDAELHSATPLVPHHYYGEEEASRDKTREWVSDHCYVESQKAPLIPGLMTGVLSLQRMGCIDPGPGWFSGELFKGLNAYKREHDLEPAMKAAVRSGAALPAQSAPNEGLTGPPGLMTPGIGTASAGATPGGAGTAGGPAAGPSENIPMPRPPVVR
jgi:hypothetical protein